MCDTTQVKATRIYEPRAQERGPNQRGRYLAEVTEECVRGKPMFKELAEEGE